jgi:hypothetical protein
MSGSLLPLPPHAFIAYTRIASTVLYDMTSGSEIKDVNMEWCVAVIDEVKKQCDWGNEQERICLI